MKQAYFREQRIEKYSQISCLYRMMNICDNLWYFNLINQKKTALWWPPSLIQKESNSRCRHSIVGIIKNDTKYQCQMFWQNTLH